MLLLLLQVGEALKRCGMHDDTRHLLVAMFDATAEDVSAEAASLFAAATLSDCPADLVCAAVTCMHTEQHAKSTETGCTEA